MIRAVNARPIMRPMFVLPLPCVVKGLELGIAVSWLAGKLVGVNVEADV
jgi:hypothetical protein